MRPIRQLCTAPSLSLWLLLPPFLSTSLDCSFFVQQPCFCITAHLNPPILYNLPLSLYDCPRRYTRQSCRNYRQCLPRTPRRSHCTFPKSQTVL
ncbi:hypothetical protein EV702DRAFT_1119750 [Suillus placidus]|uniref:Secreted protein n=1 Tax=Suillus placidus TaxID=48579 RepID=A0A9P6ZRQ3_9AGAM|nr:hypothetical protein EV702DRAFT_1119750 [Suillus placidus]